MTPVKSIRIPKACHESWEQMTPATAGRHCEQCCKTVTDFTVMSNAEIVAYLATANNVCGRFGPGQLKNLNNQLYIENLQPNSWRRWLIIIGLLSQTMFYKAVAQTKPVKIEQTDTTRGRQIPYNDDVRIGKVVSPVKPIVFESKIKNEDSCLQSTLGGVWVQRRQSFIKRTWYQIKRIF